MPPWEWILIAAVAVIAIVAVLVAVGLTSRRSKTARLKKHYGTEYERAVADTGDPKIAERELTARERKHDKLTIVPLTLSAHADFTARWRQVQTAFVDNPAAALGAADRLVSEVMHQRGYPVDTFEQRAADISVEHPHVVQNYRAAHGIHMAQRRGPVDTDQQRQAFVHYRALFETLLETSTDKETSQEATA